MAAGFIVVPVYTGPLTQINTLQWDTVGDGTGSKIQGALVRDLAGNIQPAGDAVGRGIYTYMSDGTNRLGTAANPVIVASPFTLDYDTGGGTQNMPMVGLALPGSGGAVPGGTAANPFSVNVLSGGGSAADPTPATGTISVVDAGSTSTTNALGQTVITGTPTANSFVQATLSAHTSATITLTGASAPNLTVQVERSTDGGTSFTTVAAELIGVGSTSSTYVISDTNPSVLRCNVGAMTVLRMRCTSRTAGTVAVRIQPSFGVSQIIANQGPPVASQSLSWPVRPSAYRNGGVLHRNGITAADKLAVPATPTLAAITEAGSNLTSQAYNVTVAAINRWGATTCPTVAAITPAANQAVRLSGFTVSGADTYSFFLSTGSSPLWVGFATAAQITSGGFIISAVGAATSGGGAGSGAIDIGIIGTQVASNTGPYAFNNAYTPATPTPVSCAGATKAILHVKLALADMRTSPALTIIPFFQDQTGNADWFADLGQVINLLTADGSPLEQTFTIDVNGATNMAVLVSNIQGQGAACSVWVELV